MSDPLAFSVFNLALVALVASVVGGRLLWIARRTRQTSDLLLASTVLLNGLGFGLFNLAVHTSQVPAGWRVPALTTGSLGIAAAAGCVAVFTWRVFRPSGLAPLVFVGAIILMLGAGFVNLLVAPEPAAVRTASPLYRIGLAARMLAYGWAAFESLRSHRLLQQRVRLGLARASLSRRLLLWGIAASACSANFLVVLANLLLRPTFATSSVLIVAHSVIGLAAAVCIGIASLPPDLSAESDAREANALP